MLECCSLLLFSIVQHFSSCLFFFVFFLRLRKDMIAAHGRLPTNIKFPPKVTVGMTHEAKCLQRCSMLTKVLNSMIEWNVDSKILKIFLGKFLLFCVVCLCCLFETDHRVFLLFLFLLVFLVFLFFLLLSPSFSFFLLLFSPFSFSLPFFFSLLSLSHVTDC